MTNSLSKDSHITQSLCLPKNYYSGKTKQRSRASKIATENNSIGINANKPAEVSFCGLANCIPDGFYRSEKVNKFLALAHKNQVLFSAGFALLLTGLLRPATIVSIPGKKDKDDKKYAAAHSIASGVIGFGMAFLFSTPLSGGIKKLLDNPSDYMKRNAEYFIKNSSESKAANNFLSKVPDICISPFKAIATIALLPPTLKYIFGMEKKKQKSNADLQSQVMQEYAMLNFKSQGQSQKGLKSVQGGIK